MNKELILKIKNLGFNKQREVIKAIGSKNGARRVALHVGRRGAKTSTIVLLYMMFGLMHENIRLIFIALSGDNAEQAFYPHFKEYAEKVGMYEGIDYKFNNTERLITFLSTGSTISLKGNDNSYKEAPKILGGKCFWVHIDEMQNQTQDIEKAIHFYIQQAVSDFLPKGGGGISVSGTSGDYMGENFWYRICSQPNHLGWRYFTWLDKENPHMLPAKLMEDAQFEAQYGADFQKLDWYRQQYLNEWITSGNRLVYKFAFKNMIGHPECQYTLPDNLFLSTATYGLGIDIGYSPDPSAFVVAAYNLKYSNKLYIIHEHKQNEMFVPDIHEYITKLNNKYRFAFMVADAGALAKAMVANLNITYHWSIIAADKVGKFANQNTINGDFNNESILVDGYACPELVSELQHLIWDPVKLNTENKRVEKSSLPNHLADAMLYLHHYSRHSWYKEQAHKYVPKNAQEAAAMANDELMKELVRRNFNRNNLTNKDFAVPNKRGPNGRR